MHRGGLSDMALGGGGGMGSRLCSGHELYIIAGGSGSGQAVVMSWDSLSSTLFYG